MKSIKGNLIALAPQFDAIVHGCNCFNVMGAGIAPQIDRAFSGVPSRADNTTTPGDIDKLGTISVGRYFWKEDVPTSRSYLYIINAYTQYGTARYPGECVVDYDAIRSSFALIYQLAKRHDNGYQFKIAYPMIGAGLGGGDWKLISTIIGEQLDGLDHTLIEYDGS